MKIRKMFSKVLSVPLIAAFLLTSTVFSASAADPEETISGRGVQSGIWEYSAVQAYVGGTVRITDLGIARPYQIGFSVCLSAPNSLDEDVASTSSVKYTVYEDYETKGSWNRITSGTISYKSKSRSVSGTKNEYGCDDTAILKIEFDGKIRRLISTC